MKNYSGQVWFIKAPLGHYYKCRACMIQILQPRCRNYWFIDSNGEADCDWEESCPYCREPRVILRRKWYAFFFSTRIWKWINSMRPTPKVFT